MNSKRADSPNGLSVFSWYTPYKPVLHAFDPILQKNSECKEKGRERESSVVDAVFTLPLSCVTFVWLLYSNALMDSWVEARNWISAAGVLYEGMVWN